MTHPAYNAPVELMTIPEAVKYLNQNVGAKYGVTFNRSTMWRHVITGKIQSVRIGTKHYIDGRARNRYLEELLGAIAKRAAELKAQGVTE